MPYRFKNLWPRISAEVAAREARAVQLMDEMHRSASQSRAAILDSQELLRRIDALIALPPDEP